MKFKTIFILFNLVILFSFLSLFLAPALLLGAEYFPAFASRNWIAALLFAITFAGVNLYFLFNWRLFRLLEGEDWAGLIRYLEERIAVDGQGRPRFAPFGRGMQIRLLANAYLLTSALEKVRNLERRLEERNPRFLLRHPIPFAIPYLLGGAPEEAERYFSARLARPGLRRRDWMQWNRAFTLVQAHRFVEAAELLGGMLDAAREPVLRLLILYLLGSISTDTGTRERVEQEKIRLRQRWDRERIRSRVEGTRANLEVLILSRILKDALDWLYREEPAAVGQPGRE